MERADTTRSTALWIVLGVIALIILAVVLLSGNKVSSREQTANGAAAKLMDSSLDLYYMKHGSYPSSAEDLLKEDRKDVDTLKLAMSELEDLDYKVRGDGEAYVFTYKEGSETKTVKGDYQNDYQ